jgi:BASS family bile acid:Na+ symporter
MVGCCPSGTASNVMAYLARADVALSVTVTAVNTLLAPLLTPVLLDLLAGQYIRVPISEMFIDIMTVVVAPVAAGLLLNHFAPQFTRRIAPLAPVISVAGIILIVSFIIARNAGRLSDFGWLLLLSVSLHNAAGYAGGYWLAKLCRLPEPQCRAIACEIGIQNSALDIELATKFYSGHKAIPLPGALFSLWQNLSGPVLAWYWSRKK